MLWVLVLGAILIWAPSPTITHRTTIERGHSKYNCYRIMFYALFTIETFFRFIRVKEIFPCSKKLKRNTFREENEIRKQLLTDKNVLKVLE